MLVSLVDRNDEGKRAGFHEKWTESMWEENRSENTIWITYLSRQMKLKVVLLSLVSPFLLYVVCLQTSQAPISWGYIPVSSACFITFLALISSLPPFFIPLPAVQYLLISTPLSPFPFWSAADCHLRAMSTVRISVICFIFQVPGSYSLTSSERSGH